MISTYSVSTLVGDTSSRFVALCAITDITAYLNQEIRSANGRAYFIRPPASHDKYSTGNEQQKQFLINSISISGLFDGMTNEEFNPLREAFEKVVRQLSSCLEHRLKLEGLSDTHEVVIDRDSEGAEEGDEDVIITFVLKQ